MATLNSLYIKKEVLQTLLDTLNRKKGDESKGIELTINVDDKQNQYGQNVSGWVSQTKEQREAKKQRFFVGSGKTFWSSIPTTVEQHEQKPQAQSSDFVNDETGDSFPF